MVIGSHEREALLSLDPFRRSTQWLRRQKILFEIFSTICSSCHYNVPFVNELDFVGATTKTSRVRKMPSTNSKYFEYVAVSIVVSHAGSQLHVCGYRKSLYFCLDS
jgi:hypothetical protein